MGGPQAKPLEAVRGSWMCDERGPVICDSTFERPGAPSPQDSDASPPPAAPAAPCWAFQAAGVDFALLPHRVSLHRDAFQCPCGNPVSVLRYPLGRSSVPGGWDMGGTRCPRSGPTSACCLRLVEFVSVCEETLGRLEHRGHRRCSTGVCHCAEIHLLLFLVWLRSAPPAPEWVFHCAGPSLSFRRSNSSSPSRRVAFCICSRSTPPCR